MHEQGHKVELFFLLKGWEIRIFFWCKAMKIPGYEKQDIIASNELSFLVNVASIKITQLCIINTLPLGMNLKIL